MKNNVKKTVKKAVIIPVTASVLTISMLTPGLVSKVSATETDNLQEVVTLAKVNKKLKVSKLMHRSAIMDVLDLTPEKLLQLKKDKISLRDYIEQQDLDMQEIVSQIRERAVERLDQKLSEGKISQERHDQQISQIDQKIDDWLNNHEKMFRWFGRS